MAWFKRKAAGINTSADGRNETPEGYWIKCDSCSQITSQRELLDNLQVCPACNHHSKMDSSGFLKLLLDEGSIERFDADLVADDPLEFVDRKKYTDRIKDQRSGTGLNDAIQSAIGTIDGQPIATAVHDFRFIGGSLNSVVGETIARTVKRAWERKIPLLIISQTGGARMMEGAYSLMQMAKVSAWLARYAETGMPFFSLLTHPTTGGVTASYAMLGDFNLAEPGALIGFAGPRVIRDTIGQDLPPGFQRSEFLKDHGFVDLIVHRRELRTTLKNLIQLILENGPAIGAPQANGST